MTDAVLRSPVFGGKVASFDASKAKAIAGVKAVVKIDPHGPDAPWAGVGVVADSTWAALKGRDALDVKWDEGIAAQQSSEANASKAVVWLRVDEPWLTFMVEDDGAGFDPARTKLGTGLQGMSDRLEALGGALEIRSQPGQGTTITGRVPARV